MSLLVTLGNLSWSLSGFPAWRRFKKLSKDPQAAQLAILHGLMAANRRSEYGQQYGFDQIKSYEDYQKQVPLIRYDNIHDHILKSARNPSGILTEEAVNLLEPSGGSSGGVKYIPYTTRLAGEFNRGIQSWIFNLFTRKPALMAGQAYWSISPANEIPQIEDSQIPVGFNDDSEYLSPIGRQVMRHVLCVPSAISRITDIDAFRHVSLIFLLRSKNLRLISIWNPTFLSLMLEAMTVSWDELVLDIETGRISDGVRLPEELRETLNQDLSPAPGRALELKRIGPGNPGLIWPELRLISCWMDGAAEHFARKLKDNTFPNIQFQGKGLLATEGILSFPIFGIKGAVLSVDSHFYEFLPLDENGEEAFTTPHLAHELELGKRYTVIITTGGGLYRYRLDDIVEVTDHFNALPCFRFISKTDRFSDLFGEKLSEGFVRECLQPLLDQLDLDPSFFLVAPQEDQGQTRYTLFIESDMLNNQDGEVLGEALDERLRKNFHYDFCRKLGQLDSVRVVRLTPGSAQIYLDFCHLRGQKLGDIKPSILDHHTGWEARFKVIS